ncbi:MAG TPA: hypothetical protein IAB37_05210, partial [Candidatus Faecivivens stercoravium]|nr:hypothetical protein [Candidatus Faecivivens stercoravium]
MKFEMKKRILALALAGTTAFSVFGAAMSANAAWWNEDSSHINANDDAYYKHYEAAGTISWGSTENVAKEYDINNCYTLPNAKVEGGKYVEGTSVYVTEAVYNSMKNEDIKKYVDVLDEDVKGVSYYEDEEAFADSFGYDLETVKAGQGKTYGSFEYDKVTYSIGKKTYADGSWEFFAVKKGEETEHGTLEVVQKDRTYYVSQSALEAGSDYFQIFEQKDVIDNNFKTNEAYFIDEDAPITNLDDHGTGNDGITVIVKDSYYTYGVGTDAGYTQLDSTNPEDYEAVMANPVESSGEVYLYDYVEKLPTNIGADDFADAWADGELAKFMAAHHYDGTTL